MDSPLCFWLQFLSETEESVGRENDNPSWAVEDGGKSSELLLAYNYFPTLSSESKSLKHGLLSYQTLWLWFFFPVLLTEVRWKAAQQSLRQNTGCSAFGWKERVGFIYLFTYFLHKEKNTDKFIYILLRKKILTFFFPGWLYSERSPSENFSCCSIDSKIFLIFITHHQWGLNSSFSSYSFQMPTLLSLDNDTE